MSRQPALILRAPILRRIRQRRGSLPPRRHFHPTDCIATGPTLWHGRTISTGCQSSVLTIRQLDKRGPFHQRIRPSAASTDTYQEESAIAPPPQAVGRGRGGPYPVGRGRPRPSNPLADMRPRGLIPSQESAFVRARNLFRDFIPNIESPTPMVRTFPGPPPLPQPPRTPSPEPPKTPSPPLANLPASRTPSPDIFLELYQHGRHPFDDRSHMTIIPS